MTKQKWLMACVVALTTALAFVLAQSHREMVADWLELAAKRLRKGEAA
jgi:hypothetical protein